MKTQIDISCPDCHSHSLKKNGIKSYGKQNYQCKDCK
ncbi:transposase-like zinc-binding domain-containing protein, partial [Psychrobacter sp. AOP29-E1-4]